MKYLKKKNTKGEDTYGLQSGTQKPKPQGAHPLSETYSNSTTQASRCTSLIRKLLDNSRLKVLIPYQKHAQKLKPQGVHSLIRNIHIPRYNIAINNEFPIGPYAQNYMQQSA